MSFRYTLGERMAAHELLDESRFFHLHGDWRIHQSTMTRVVLTTGDRWRIFRSMVELSEAAARLATTSASIAGYCDRAEHLETTGPRGHPRGPGWSYAPSRPSLPVTGRSTSSSRIGSDSSRSNSDTRLYPAGGFAAVDAIPASGATLRLLQSVQWDHDRYYHPDVPRTLPLRAAPPLCIPPRKARRRSKRRRQRQRERLHRATPARPAAVRTQARDTHQRAAARAGHQLADRARALAATPAPPLRPSVDRAIRRGLVRALPPTSRRFAGLGAIRSG